MVIRLIFTLLHGEIYTYVLEGRHITDRDKRISASSVIRTPGNTLWSISYFLLTILFINLERGFTLSPLPEYLANEIHTREICVRINIGRLMGIRFCR